MATCNLGLALPVTTAAAFTVVLDIAISTTLISYLWIFPASLRLRYTHPHVHRPYRHPFGMTGIWISTILVTGWILLGSWVAVFPDSLEKLFGVGYGFKDAWGVDRVTFEYLTLGTLLVIVAIGVIGYWLGADVRAQTATTELGVDAADALATQPAG